MLHKLFIAVKYGCRKFAAEFNFLSSHDFDRIIVPQNIKAVFRDKQECSASLHIFASDSRNPLDKQIPVMLEDSIFKVREVFALTNQLGNFFDLNEPNLDFFKKIFLTAFQGQKKPLSHHEDVIGAEIEKAR